MLHKLLEIISLCKSPVLAAMLTPCYRSATINLPSLLLDLVDLLQLSFFILSDFILETSQQQCCNFFYRTAVADCNTAVLSRGPSSFFTQQEIQKFHVEESQMAA